MTRVCMTLWLHCSVCVWGECDSPHLFLRPTMSVKKLSRCRFPEKLSVLSILCVTHAQLRCLPHPWSATEARKLSFLFIFLITETSYRHSVSVSWSLIVFKRSCSEMLKFEIFPFIFFTLHSTLLTWPFDLLRSALKKKRTLSKFPLLNEFSQTQTGFNCSFFLSPCLFEALEAWRSAGVRDRTTGVTCTRSRDPSQCLISRKQADWKRERESVRERERERAKMWF